ncbi:uncharacterized protein LOC136033338 [Artemia franciscana]|uniref:uncharacterized protein LOC136033338 n=1 Tax=Artemia franciscana TaxID=6661 RepID=UPI0032DBBED3
MLRLSTLSPVAYNAKKRFPTFLLCNARSLCNKIDEIDVVLRQNNVSVADITETWNLTEVTGRLTGYALYLRTRQALGDQRLGGGVALYVREDISMTELRELESTEHEAVWVWCKPSAMRRAYSCIIFASIYYPESAKNRRDLVTYLQKTVDHLRAFYGNPAIVLAGDFNQTKKSWLASCLSLKQVVNFPTHESGSILDLILTNSAASIPKPKIKRVKYRPLTDSAICTYGRWIATYPFPEVYGDKSLDKKCQLFNEILHAKYLEFFPEKTFTRCESDKPWITPQIKKLIRKKCKLFQEGDLQNAKKLRNHITSLTRSAKKDYGREKFSDSLRHTNPRKWHRAVKQITGKSIHNSIKISHPDGTYTTANEVNQYFTRIWTSFPSPTQARKSEILDSCADEGEVVIDEMTTYKTLMKVKVNCSAYPDELPPKLIREYAPFIAKPLSVLINLCFRIFPAVWKKAYVRIIPKVTNP